MIKLLKSKKWLLLILSLLFCFGFFFTIANVHYFYYYNKFIAIEREDLISRLVFLSKTMGSVFYPLVILPVFLLNYFVLRAKERFWTIFFLSVLSVCIIGLLIYFRVIGGNLIYGTMGSIVLGISLLLISLVSFYYVKKTFN